MFPSDGKWRRSLLRVPPGCWLSACTDPRAVWGWSTGWSRTHPPSPWRELRRSSARFCTRPWARSCVCRTASFFSFLSLSVAVSWGVGSDQRALSVPALNSMAGSPVQCGHLFCVAADRPLRGALFSLHESRERAAREDSKVSGFTGGCNPATGTGAAAKKRILPN